MTIKIFQKEIDDGIGDLVKTTASVAYCSQATFNEENKQVEGVNLDKIIAENKDQLDLYYLETVLVSTGWNKNDDVFLPEPTWAARNTPEDKQFNFMHDENDIIGHITGSYVLDKDGKAVSDELEEAPKDFDIITQAVLYNSWTNHNNRERMDKIISEIKAGQWYVSMECLFAGFNYALRDSDGNCRVLTRDESSAFLTKHLRSYGGTGEYEGYEVGRALSSIAFSGKGLVNKPANPRSIILNSRSVAFSVEDTDSKFSIGEINMSDQSLLEKQLAETKTQLVETKAEVEAVKAKIEEAKDKEFASKVESYEAAIESYKSSAAESVATIEELQENIKSSQARVAELEDALVASQEELASAVKKVDEMKEKEKQEKRKAALVEAGLDEEEAQEALVSFKSLDDETFDSVAGLMKKKSAKASDEVEAETVQEETEAEELTPDALEEVETSEATLVVSEGTDELETAQASVADWFGKHVLNSK